MSLWNNGSGGAVVISDSYRVISEVLRNVTANVPINVALPLTTAEQQLVANGTLKFPSISLLPNTTSGNLSVAVGLFDKVLWNSSNNSVVLISDIVVVQVIGGLKFVDITFPVSSEPPPPPVNYSIICKAGERKWKNYTCIDSGFTDYFQCIGIPGVYKGNCPVLSESCSALDLSSRSIASVASGQVCTTLNATLTFRTCRCTVGSAAQLGTNEVAAGVVVKFVGSDFSNTFKAAGALNSQGAASKASTMIILFSSLWGSAVVLMLFFGMRRFWELKASGKSASVSQKNVLVKRSVLRQKILRLKNSNVVGKGESLGKLGGDNEQRDDPALVMQALVDYINSIFPAVFSSKPLYRVLVSEMYIHHEYIHFFFKLADDDRPVLLIFKMICLQSYLLFLLALLYDLNYPDDDGSCEDITNQSSCLERKSLLDSSQTYCQWTYYGGSSVGNYDGFAICSYNQPEFSFNTALYISTMITFATILYMIPMEYFLDVLAAPILPIEKKSASVVPAAAEMLPDNTPVTAATLQTRVAESTHTLPEKARGSSLLEDSLCWNKHVTISARHLPYTHYPPSSFSKILQTYFNLMEEQRSSLRLSLGLTSVLTTMEALEIELRAQANVLQKHPELLVKFCRSWGLESSGTHFMKEIVALSRQDCLGSCRSQRRTRCHARELVEHDLKEIEKKEMAAWKEIQLFQTASERGYELLRLFVVDLLGRDTSAAIVFKTKTEMECPAFTSSAIPKVFVLLLLLSLDAFFIYYAILKGFSKGLSWQGDYVKAWGLQVVLDVAVFETVKCLWLHVFLPRFVGKEVRYAKDQVVKTIADLVRGERLDSEGDVQELPGGHHSLVLPADLCVLNGPSFFFISHRLSNKLPSLMESWIVRAYYSAVPGALGAKWEKALHLPPVGRAATKQRKKKKGWCRGWSHVFRPVLHSVVALPLTVQNMLLRFSEPLLLYAITFILLLLAEHPMYAIGGGVIVLGGLVALFWDSFHPPPPSFNPSVLETKKAAVVTSNVVNVEGEILLPPNVGVPAPPPSSNSPSQRHPRGNRSLPSSENSSVSSYSSRKSSYASSDDSDKYLSSNKVTWSDDRKKVKLARASDDDDDILWQKDDLSEFSLGDSISISSSSDATSYSSSPRNYDRKRSRTSSLESTGSCGV